MARETEARRWLDMYIVEILHIKTVSVHGDVKNQDVQNPVA